MINRLTCWDPCWRFPSRQWWQRSKVIIHQRIRRLTGIGIPIINLWYILIFLVAVGYGSFFLIIYTSDVYLPAADWKFEKLGRGGHWVSGAGEDLNGMMSQDGVLILRNTLHPYGTTLMSAKCQIVWYIPILCHCWSFLMIVCTPREMHGTWNDISTSRDKCKNKFGCDDAVCCTTAIVGLLSWYSVVWFSICHYNDVMMGPKSSQITSLAIVY